jgi:tetratricopeptide (TPR) repeat protein
MAKSRKKELKEDVFTKITKKTEQFIVNNLKTILLVITTAVILGGAYFSVDQIISRKEKEAESAFSKIYLAYSDANADANLDDGQLKEKLMTLNEDFVIVLERYPKSSAASRSAYYIGNTLYRYEKYEEALEYYAKGASIKQKSYSAVLCVQGEASCYEQLEDYENAQNRYKYIIDKYSDSFLVPMVRFSLGQIYEKQNMYDNAKEQYDSIVTDYSWSSWADLAEKKILLLKNTNGNDKA